MTWGLARVSGDVKGVLTADTTPTFIELGPDQQGSNIAGPAPGSNSNCLRGTKLFFWRFLWLTLGLAAAKSQTAEIRSGFSTGRLACH
jgi:hypothetical protein